MRVEDEASFVAPSFGAIDEEEEEERRRGPKPASPVPSVVVFIVVRIKGPLGYPGPFWAFGSSKAQGRLLLVPAGPPAAATTSQVFLILLASFFSKHFRPCFPKHLLASFFLNILPLILQIFWLPFSSLLFSFLCLLTRGRQPEAVWPEPPVAKDAAAADWRQ
jgi:hypothetical protein